MSGDAPDGAAISVLATFHARAGHEDDVAELLGWMVGQTRAEPGCERYDLYRAADDERRFHLVERYADDAALEAHRAADHYKEYRKRIADLIEGSVGVTLLHGIDVAR